MMLVQFAETELAKVDLGYDGMINEAALAIIKVFAEQGHSGGSAAITTAAVARLMQFQPLSPLTGEDDEWTEVADGTWQNKRCPSVFKDAERAWDIDLPPMSAGDGTDAWRTIMFPYTPGQPVGGADDGGFDRRAAKLGGSADA